jgi:tetratricopeptide (TPR) repeat protein
VEFAAPAARRAAELGAHREAAAQYERALRCAEGTDAAMTAALCDGLAYELSLLDRWQEAAEVRERALALWRECGDRLREGDTLRRLSRAWCRLCRGSAALEAAEAALTTLTPLGPTPELSWAYANLATQRMLLEQAGPAVELAHRAQEIAESLGVSEALCDALNTAGCALATQGGDWAVPLRRALDIALAENLVEQAGRAYANLHGVYCGQRRFAAAERYYLDGVAYCDDHDITTFATCLRGERAITFEKTGRWDECVALSVTLLRDVAASPINRISPLTMQGVIRARRGEPGVWECLDDATTLADGTDEPQQIVPVRLARAEAHWLQGECRVGAGRGGARCRARRRLQPVAARRRCGVAAACRLGQDLAGGDRRAVPVGDRRPLGGGSEGVAGARLSVRRCDGSRRCRRRGPAA